MQRPRRRYAYSLAYLLMAAAGAAAIAWPAPSVATATNGIEALLYTWDTFLLAGGSLALYGAFTDRWVGESLGLPLLFVVFAIYGVSAFAVAFSTDRPSSIAGGLALASIAGMIAGRWREVNEVRRSAVKASVADGQ